MVPGLRLIETFPDKNKFPIKSDIMLAKRISFSNNLRKVSADSTVTTIAGNSIPGYIDGEGSVARFNSPFGITIDDNGKL